jgi:hypothetical protein
MCLSASDELSFYLPIESKPIVGAPCKSAHETIPFQRSNHPRLVGTLVVDDMGLRDISVAGVWGEVESCGEDQIKSKEKKV